MPTTYLHKYDNIYIEECDKKIQMYIKVISLRFNILITRISGVFSGTHAKKDGVYKAIDFVVLNNNKKIDYSYKVLRYLIDVAEAMNFDFRFGFYYHKGIHADCHTREFRGTRSWYCKKRGMYFYPYRKGIHDKNNYPHTYDIQNSSEDMLEYLYKEGIIKDV